MGSVASPATPDSPMPSANSPLHLQPTWQGYVSDTKDALMLFEAVLSGTLSRVLRRPHDRERAALIRSGSIFIYEEDRSGIKRWTDGVPWSPSRILNNFLIYRELDKPFPPGEKKRAKKPKRDMEDTNASHEMADGSLASPGMNSGPSSPGLKNDAAIRDSERSLVGSLTDSYAFKPGGLVKKTMSVHVGGTNYHLVSYYVPEEVKAGLLEKPTSSHLRWIMPRAELLHNQNFRAPLDEGDEAMTPSPFPNQPRNQFIAAQPPYLQHPGYPTQPAQYSPQGPYYHQMPNQGQYGEAQRPAYHMPASPHNNQQHFYQDMGRGQAPVHQQHQHGLPSPQQQQQIQGQHSRQPLPQHSMPQYSQYPDVKYEDVRHYPAQGGYQASPQQMHGWSNQQG